MQLTDDNHNAARGSDCERARTREERLLEIQIRIERFRCIHAGLDTLPRHNKAMDCAILRQLHRRFSPHDESDILQLIGAIIREERCRARAIRTTCESDDSKFARAFSIRGRFQENRACCRVLDTFNLGSRRPIALITARRMNAIAPSGQRGLDLCELNANAVARTMTTFTIATSIGGNLALTFQERRFNIDDTARGSATDVPAVTFG